MVCMLSTALLGSSWGKDVLTILEMGSSTKLAMCMQVQQLEEEIAHLRQLLRCSWSSSMDSEEANAVEASLMNPTQYSGANVHSMSGRRDLALQGECHNAQPGIELDPELVGSSQNCGVGLSVLDGSAGPHEPHLAL